MMVGPTEDYNDTQPPPLTLGELQREVKEWQGRNFPRGPEDDYHPLLGIIEEGGELAHAHLKHKQGIRGYDDPVKFAAEAQDAVGDLLVYLADYCNQMGFDLQHAIEVTWGKVRKRDWQADPAKGGDEDLPER
jgi:NTP pyrophosphatase (non-canonical NTP hydrolase)